MPLVPSSAQGDKRTLSLRLPRDFARKLTLYRHYSKAPPGSIVKIALERLFEQDDQFAPWVTANGGALLRRNQADDSDVVADFPAPRAATR